MEGEAGRAPDTVAAPASTSAGRPPLHWLLEGLFIVASVVLGFGISEYGKYRDDRALAAQMLAGIHAEVEYNRALLEPFLPMHRVWLDALGRVDANGSGSGLDVFFATRPQLPPSVRTNVPLFRSAAWETAQSTGSLRLINYDLAAGLSEIYGMQEHAASAFSNLFAQAAFYDPSGRSATLRLVQTAMTEMTWAEETLLALYDKHLPAIRAAE